MVSEIIKNLERRYKQGNSFKIGESVFSHCLKECKLYRRGTGTFGSSAFKNYLGALSDIVNDGTKIEIMCSMNGIANDKALFDAIKGTSSEKGRNAILQDFCNKIGLIVAGCQQTAESNNRDYFQKLIAYLIANNQLEIKFALPLKDNLMNDDYWDLQNIKERAMYHFKYGYFVFEDTPEDSILAFEGSINETDTALYHSGESVILHKSWEDDQKKDVNSIKLWMDEDWNENNDSYRIYNISPKTLDIIKKYASKTRPFKPEDFKPIDVPNPIPDPNPQPDPAPDYNNSNGYNLFDLREYQKRALIKWQEAGFKGILNLATGTGKTLTALHAIKNFKLNIPSGLVLIVVPSSPLAIQWKNDIKEMNESISIIEVSDSYKQWEDKIRALLTQSFISKLDNTPIIIGLIDSISSSRFQTLIHQVNNSLENKHLIIADECHGYNSPTMVEKFPEAFNYRLGLSATVYDKFDIKDEKHHLETYFGEIVDTFSIKDAIYGDEPVLTKYNYHVIEALMNDDEADRYDELTEKIRKLSFIDDVESSYEKTKEQYFYERARLIASIENKLKKLSEIIAKNKKGFTLAYCGGGNDDEGDQKIKNVTRVFDQQGWTVAKITSKEQKEERVKIIENLKNETIDVVVSIKVLDEGVNIPAVRTAYILASTRSEREHIQRRGRVLRQSSGKKSADIYDFVVLGSMNNNSNLKYKSLIKNELERVWTFSEDAENKIEIQEKYSKLAHEVGLFDEEIFKNENLNG